MASPVQEEGFLQREKEGEASPFPICFPMRPDELAVVLNHVYVAGSPYPHQVVFKSDGGDGFGKYLVSEKTGNKINPINPINPASQ